MCIELTEAAQGVLAGALLLGFAGLVTAVVVHFWGYLDG